jgi:hypothetical protein
LAEKIPVGTKSSGGLFLHAAGGGSGIKTKLWESKKSSAGYGGPDPAFRQATYSMFNLSG